MRCIVAGESLDLFAERGLDDQGDWHVGPGESAEYIFELYRGETARSNEIIAATPLDAPPAQRLSLIHKMCIRDRCTRSTKWSTWTYRRW